MRKLGLRNTILSILVILSIFLSISVVGAAAPQIIKQTINADGTIDIYFDQEVTAGDNFYSENLVIKDANGNLIQAKAIMINGPETPVYNDRVHIYVDPSQIPGNTNIDVTLSNNLVKNKNGESNTQDTFSGVTPSVFADNILGQIIAGITKLFTNPGEFFNDLLNSNPQQISVTQGGSGSGSTSTCSTSSGSPSSGSPSSGSPSSDEWNPEDLYGNDYMICPSCGGKAWPEGAVGVYVCPCGYIRQSWNGTYVWTMHGVGPEYSNYPIYYG